MYRYWITIFIGGLLCTVSLYPGLAQTLSVQEALVEEAQQINDTKNFAIETEEIAKPPALERLLKSRLKENYVDAVLFRRRLQIQGQGEAKVNEFGLTVPQTQMVVAGEFSQVRLYVREFTVDRVDLERQISELMNYAFAPSGTDQLEIIEVASMLGGFADSSNANGGSGFGDFLSNQPLNPESLQKYLQNLREANAALQSQQSGKFLASLEAANQAGQNLPNYVRNLGMQYLWFEENQTADLSTSTLMSLAGLAFLVLLGFIVASFINHRRLSRVMGTLSNQDDALQQQGEALLQVAQSMSALAGARSGGQVGGQAGGQNTETSSSATGGAIMAPSLSDEVPYFGFLASLDVEQFEAFCIGVTEDLTHANQTDRILTTKAVALNKLQPSVAEAYFQRLHAKERIELLECMGKTTLPFKELLELGQNFEKKAEELGLPYIRSIDFVQQIVNLLQGQSREFYRRYLQKLNKERNDLVKKLFDTLFDLQAIPWVEDAPLKQAANQMGARNYLIAAISIDAQDVEIAQYLSEKSQTYFDAEILVPVGEDLERTPPTPEEIQLQRQNLVEKLRLIPEFNSRQTMLDWLNSGDKTSGPHLTSSSHSHEKGAL